MDLRSFFETILIDYKNYKEESFSKSKFRSFITIEGKKIISDLLPDDYEVTCFCGRKKWAKSINIRINSRKYNPKFSIVYSFKENNTGFTLFLSSNLKFDIDFRGYDHTSNDKLVKECREKLSGYFDEELVNNYRDYLNVTRNDFTVKNIRSMIYAKSYSLPLVSQEELLTDLSNFIDFYTYLNGDVESNDNNLVLDSTESLIESEYETTEETDSVDYKMYDSFYDYLLENDYYFDKETIENYLLSLKVKPFTIFTGNSGTGKTKLSQLFAKYLAKEDVKKVVVNEDLPKEDYLEAEIPIGSTQVKNSVFKEVLPLDVYSGSCDYIIDGFHVKGNISLYVKLKLKDKTTTGDIKIKYEDILDLITNEGYLVDNFATKVKVGSSYYRHTWDLSDDNNIEELIPIKSYSKECEIIVDGVPQKNNISIYPVVRFDNDEELSNHLKKLYDENPSQLIDLKIDLTNFERDSDDSDYVIPLKSSSSDIVVENLDDEYFSFEVVPTRVGRNYLNKGELRFPAKSYFNSIIDFKKLSNEIVKFKVDDLIDVKGNLRINFYMNCKDDSLSDYFKNSIGKHSFSIDVKKEDIKKSILSTGDVSFEDIIFEVKLGNTLGWSLPVDQLNNLIPIKRKNKLNCKVDGKETVFNLIIHKIEFSFNEEENPDFISYVEENSINSEDKITIRASADAENINSVINLDYLDSISNVIISNNEESDNEISSKLIESNYKIVPVGANWTENRNIVGYYNLITEEYQSTPAYDLINQSKDNLEAPHFLILDEMNLSHVERYFADFLSAIESGENIPLYGIDDDLEIPENLFIIGTVNVDETTYMFSPKVLDRANVLEFETYSSKDYMKGNINLNAPEGNIGYLENPLIDSDIRNLGINELKESFNGVKVQNTDFWDLLSDEIFKFQTILKESGFDFGFRVINEIVRFMLVAWRYEGEPVEWTNWERYFDAQIKQKLLPKLHGSEKILEDTLQDLAKACEDEEGIKYYTSAKKLNEMIKVLDKQRYVSFIN